MKTTPRPARLALAAVLACACAQGTDVDGVIDDEEEGDSSNDETCATKVCDPNATCDDSGGSAVCTCASGYTGDGETCTDDVDECAAVPGVCGEHATCTDTPDGHACTCEPGYEDQGGVCVKPGGCAQTPCAQGCSCQDAMATAVCTCSFTHSSSQTIEPGGSASCNSEGIEHAENSYYRVFDLAALGVTGAFTVTGVQIGFEQVKSNVGSQSATLKLHTLAGALATANLTLVTSNPITVLDTATLTVANFPINGTAAAGSQLVVELFTPDGAGLGNLIYVGSNSLPETGPTYLRAPSCMFPEPVTTAAIMFPNMHWVLNVAGTYTPG